MLRFSENSQTITLRDVIELKRKLDNLGFTENYDLRVHQNEFDDEWYIVLENNAHYSDKAQATQDYKAMNVMLDYISDKHYHESDSNRCACGKMGRVNLQIRTNAWYKVA